MKFLNEKWRFLNQCYVLFKFFLQVAGLTLIVISYQNCTGGFQTLEMEEDHLSFLSMAQTKALDVLANNCNSCHGSSDLGGVKNITSVQHLISAGLIVPGEPGQSKLFKAVERNSMPPTYALSTEDKTILSNWILLLGRKGPGGSVVPSDLSFNMTISTEPQLFRHRLLKIQNLLGNPNSAGLSLLYENRYLLGDYDHAKGVTPKYSFEVNDMQNWLKSVEPVCKSFEFYSRYSWPTGAAALVQAALGRDLQPADNEIIQSINSLSVNGVEKIELLCLTTLGSLEFISK